MLRRDRQAFGEHFPGFSLVETLAVLEFGYDLDFFELLLAAVEERQHLI